MAKKNAKLKQRIAELERENIQLAAMLDMALRKNDSPGHMIEAILQGIAPLFIGYKQNTVDTRAQEIMGAIGEQAYGTPPEHPYFPDVEFDPYMESATSWPTAGEISQPTKPQVTTLNGSYRIENGEPVRSDGEVMFQAGTTGPPPDSAIE
jgi:hypothetical protein